METKWFIFNWRRWTNSNFVFGGFPRTITYFRSEKSVANLSVTDTPWMYLVSLKHLPFLLWLVLPHSYDSISIILSRRYNIHCDSKFIYNRQIQNFFLDGMQIRPTRKKFATNLCISMDTTYIEQSNRYDIHCLSPSKKKKHTLFIHNLFLTDKYKVSLQLRHW